MHVEKNCTDVSSVMSTWMIQYIVYFSKNLFLFCFYKLFYLSVLQALSFIHQTECQILSDVSTLTKKNIVFHTFYIRICSHKYIELFCCNVQWGWLKAKKGQYLEGLLQRVSKHIVIHCNIHLSFIFLCDISLEFSHSKWTKIVPFFHFQRYFLMLSDLKNCTLEAMIAIYLLFLCCKV